MDKLWLTPETPAGLHEDWPNKYDAFSWLEYVLTVPNPIYIITTRKPNGQPNACLHSWNMHVGQRDNLSSLIYVLGHSHTHANILREGHWVINYPPVSLWQEAFRTIGLGDDVDEITSAGLTPEPSVAVPAPSIVECPMCVECRLDWHRDIGAGTLFAGRIMGARVDPSRLPADPDRRIEALGLMYNVRGTIDPATREMYGPNTLGVLGQVKRISPDAYFAADGSPVPLPCPMREERAGDRSNR